MREIVAATEAGRDGDEIVPYQTVRELDAGRVPESDAEAEHEGPDGNWKFWQEQISTALIHERRWRSEALDCERLYFGEDEDPGVEGAEDVGDRNRVTDKVALIHANVDTLKPLLFSETPQPVVRRRFRGDGGQDETDLMAAEAVQRLASYMLDTEDFDGAMVGVRDDWLIAGRGAARVYYKADFANATVVDPATGLEVTVEVKADERVCPRYVEWRRLVLAPSHSWDQMPWLAFEVPMTRSKIEARFGPEIAARFAYNQRGLAGSSRAISDEDRTRNDITGTHDETGEPAISPFDGAIVWEIWNKDSGRVIWWSPSYKDGILDKEDDPLQLEKFYPMPRPLLATTKGEQMTPRPDIKYYERRAREIDIATEKMRDILDVISVSGMFPGEMKDEVQQLLSGKSRMIPVSAWLRLMEKGGTANLIQWLPLQAMVQAIQALVTLREQSKQAMFEASGVSDIMRAQGDARETATAQSIKGKYAGLRLTDRQRRIAVYARDLLRLMIEVAVEQFDTDRLADITGLDLPKTEAERQAMTALQEQMRQEYAQVAQAHQMATEAGLPVPPLHPPPEEQHIPGTSWELVHARLRSDIGRKITITIETDSTVLSDEQSDKELRVEFIASFSMFVERLAPLLMSGQFDMKIVKELLMFGIRGFPKARTLEGLIMQLPDEAPQKDGGPPVPVIVAQIRAEVDQMKEQMRAAENEKDRQHEMRMKGVDLVADSAKMGADMPPAPQPPQM